MYSTTSTLQTVITALLVMLTMCAASPVYAWDKQSISSDEITFTASGIGGAGGAGVDAFEALVIISNDELAGLRGGFEISGLQIDIGAYIRTFIDGVQVLESMVNLTGSDAIGGLPSVSTVLNAIDFKDGLQIVDSSTGGLAGVRDQIPDQIDLGALNNASGVILNDSKGFTAALHQITRSQIISAIVNTASGRQLRQEVEVSVDIANFRQLQGLSRNALRAGALSRAGRIR